MAFDVRVGLFDDPPSKETKKMLKMIKAVFDGFALLGKLNSGWEGLLYRFIKTPSYKLKTSRFPPAKRLLTERLWNWTKWQKKANSFLKIKVTYTNINTKLFRYRASLRAGVLLIYHSILSFIKKCCTLLKHRSSVACAGVCYSCETNWFWLLEAHHPVITMLHCYVGGGKENDSPVWTDIIQEIISSL